MLMTAQKRFSILLVGLILAVTASAFSPCLQNDFLSEWDDNVHLTGNPLVRSLSLANIKEIFLQYVNGTYNPLTILSFALEYHFFRYDPFVYHLNNILLHLGVTALVFVFARQAGLSWWAAALASLLFGIHPMHVESVAWVTERKDVLYAFFYMSALCVWWRYLDSGKLTLFAATFLLGLLSMLAKPMALSLPWILLLVDRLHGRKFTRRVFLEKIPFLLYAIPLTAITYWVHMRVPGQDPLEAVLLWAWSLVFYIRQFFLPFVLIPLYPVPEPVAFSQIDYGISVSAAAALIYLLWRFRHHRFVSFAGLFFLGSVFFLLRYDTTVDVSFVADRFMYLPSLGFCLLLGAAGERALAWGRARGRMRVLGVTVAIFALIAAGAVKTYHQCGVWKNGITLWAYVIRQNEASALAYNNRGCAYMDLGKNNLALQDFNQAIRLDPREAKSYYNKGNLYKKIGLLKKALGNYNQAVSIEPGYLFVYNNRGGVYSRLGNYRAAILDFDRAIYLNPNDPKHYYNRGLTYYRMKRPDLAAQDFERAREMVAKGFPIYYEEQRAFRF